MKEALDAALIAASTAMADVASTGVALAFELQGSTYVADFAWTQSGSKSKLISIVELQDTVGIVGLSNTATGEGIVQFN